MISGHALSDMETDEARRECQPLPENEYGEICDSTGVQRRKFFCTECPKMFFRKSHIENHMRIHTGEKPYTCGVCLRQFRQDVQLRTHERKFHPDMCPAFVCPICGEKFLLKKELTQHQNDLRHYKVLINMK